MVGVFARSAQSIGWTETLDDELALASGALRIERSRDAVLQNRTTEGRASFEAKVGTPPWRRQELQLVLGSDTRGAASVAVNGRHVARVALPGGESPTFVSQAVEITELSERTAQSTLTIAFELQGTQPRACVALATAADGAGTKVRDVPDRRYSAVAVWFFASTWLALLAGLALWYLARQSQSIAQGIAPVLLGLAMWVVPLVVSGDTVKQLSPQVLLRRLFSALGKPGPRIAVCAALSAAFAVLATLDADALDGLLTKSRYRQLIQAATRQSGQDFSAVASAFEYLPWRREAFLAYEVQSAAVKTTSVEGWRRQVAGMLADGKLVAAAKAFDPQQVKWYLVDPDERSLVVQDPILSVAHILPEAESDEQLDRKMEAIRLLESERPRDLRARLLKLYFEYDVAGSPDGGKYLPGRTTDAVAADLRKAIDEFNDRGGKRPHEYFAAVDLLAFHLATGSCSPGSVNESIKLYSLIVADRTNPAAASRVWLRSPGKFTLFHLWRYVQADGVAARDPVWGRYFASYRPLLAGCKLFDDELRGLFKTSGASIKDESWTRNTSMSGELATSIMKEVELGWRF